MNKVILMGRLTRDPEVRYSQGDNAMAIARYTLAVDRRFNRNNNDENSADFIGCVAFGKSAEFAERYLHKGTKIVATGRIQTGSYVNKDGVKVYTTDVVVEDQEFAESKNSAASNDGGYNGGGYNSAPARPQPAAATDGFMNIPDGIDEVVDSLFSGCYTLTEIVIPKSVTTVSRYSFENCQCMKRYYFLPDSPPELTTTGTFLGLPKDCKFYVPKGRLDVYQTAESWSNYASYMVEMEGDVP